MQIAPVAGKVLSDEQLAVLMSAVSSKVELSNAASRDSSSSCLEKKECPFLDKYLMETHWTQFQNASIEPESLIMLMAMIFSRLGLTGNVRESTYALGAALALQARVVSTDDLLIAKRRLKDDVAAIKHDTLVPSPTVYPESLDAFKEDYPELYARAFPEQPAPTKWSSEMRQMIQSRAPCRSTKQGAHVGPVVSKKSSVGMSFPGPLLEPATPTPKEN